MKLNIVGKQCTLIVCTHACFFIACTVCFMYNIHCTLYIHVCTQVTHTKKIGKCMLCNSFNINDDTHHAHSQGGSRGSIEPP